MWQLSNLATALPSTTIDLLKPVVADDVQKYDAFVAWKLPGTIPGRLFTQKPHQKAPNYKHLQDAAYHKHLF